MVLQMGFYVSSYPAVGLVGLAGVLTLLRISVASLGRWARGGGAPAIPRPSRLFLDVPVRRLVDVLPCWTAGRTPPLTPWAESMAGFPLTLRGLARRGPSK